MSLLKSFNKAWKNNLDELQSESMLTVRTQWLLMSAVLLGVFLIRLITIEAPNIDRSSWKEIDYLMISKSYHEHGYQFLYPEIEWPAEAPRYTAMELPLVPYIASLSYATFGYNAFAARLLTLVAWLVVGAYTFKLAKRELGPLIGLAAGFTASVLPLHHPFARFLFSEPTVIAFSVVAVYHFAQWFDFNKRRDLIVATAAFSLAIALKLTPLYLLLPLTWIAVRKLNITWKATRIMATVTAVALVLPLAWYSWAWHLAQSYIDVFGVFGGKFGGHNKFQSVTMLTSGWWYETMADRLMWQVLGSKIAVGLAVVGVASAGFNRKAGLPFAYLCAIGAFFGLVAEGQIDAPYRQLTIVPAISIFVAYGALAIVAAGKCLFDLFEANVLSSVFRKRIHDWLASFCLPNVWSAAVLAVLFVIPLSTRSQIFAREKWTPNSNNKWAIAHKLKELVPPESKLITLGEYTIHEGGNDLSPMLYFYSGMRGWSLQSEDCDLNLVGELATKGANTFVAMGRSREPKHETFLKELKNRYETLYETDEVLILKIDRGSNRQLAER
jgi:hypothetical protein